MLAGWSYFRDRILRDNAAIVFDLDLELIDSRTLDGSIQELTYAPTLHTTLS